MLTRLYYIYRCRTRALLIYLLDSLVFLAYETILVLKVPSIFSLGPLNSRAVSIKLLAVVR